MKTKKDRFRKILQNALKVAEKKGDKQKINKIKKDLDYLENGDEYNDKNE